MIVSDTVPFSRRVSVASPNVTSVMFGVHLLFGHVGVGGNGSGSYDVRLNRNWPFSASPAGQSFLRCPGRVLSRRNVSGRVGALDSRDALRRDRDRERRSAETATLPLHSTCVPTSVQVGVPTKRPLCAVAALGNANAASAPSARTKSR